MLRGVKNLSISPFSSNTAMSVSEEIKRIAFAKNFNGEFDSNVISAITLS